MEWVVTTGRTVEEAKDAALDELGVDEHDAEFEILEEPQQGLFGRQRGEARVRARVRPSTPRPKTERRDRKRRRPDAAPAVAGPAAAPAESADADDGPGVTTARRRGRGTKRQADEAAESAPPAASKGGSPRRRPAASPADGTPGVQPQADGEAGGEAGDAGPEGTAGPARRRRRGKRGAGVDAVAGTGDDDGDDGLSDGGADMGEQELDLAQQAEIAETFLRGLLERFGMPAQTTTTTLDEETFEVHVDGEELGLLIGPKGQTLQAVQELTRTAVQRRASNRTGRILVDVAGYRVRRREALERFTRQVADDVRATGVQRVLEPMSAADRKIVHDTANQIEGVGTMSEGEEPSRRVVIVPATAAEPDTDAD